MKGRRQYRRLSVRTSRSGVALPDYVMTLSVLFIMSGFIVMYSRRIMQLVYEMTGFFLSWPFM